MQTLMINKEPSLRDQSCAGLVSFSGGGKHCSWTGCVCCLYEYEHSEWGRTPAGSKTAFNMHAWHFVADANAKARLYTIAQKLPYLICMMSMTLCSEQSTCNEHQNSRHPTDDAKGVCENHIASFSCSTAITKNPNLQACSKIHLRLMQWRCALGSTARQEVPQHAFLQKSVTAIAFELNRQCRSC